MNKLRIVSLEFRSFYIGGSLNEIDNLVFNSNLTKYK